MSSMACRDSVYGRRIRLVPSTYWTNHKRKSSRWNSRYYFLRNWNATNRHSSVICSVRYAHAYDRLNSMWTLENVLQCNQCSFIVYCMNCVYCVCTTEHVCTDANEALRTSFVTPSCGSGISIWTETYKVAISFRQPQIKLWLRKHALHTFSNFDSTFRFVRLCKNVEMYEVHTSHNTYYKLHYTTSASITRRQSTCVSNLIVWNVWMWMNTRLDYQTCVDCIATSVHDTVCSCSGVCCGVFDLKTASRNEVLFLSAVCWLHFCLLEQFALTIGTILFSHSE